MINMILDDASDRMQKAIEAYQRDLATVRTGRATPAMLDRVMVNYYGSPTPINQMAGVSVVEGRQLVIKPYDKSALKAQSVRHFYIMKSLTAQDIRLDINPIKLTIYQLLLR